MMQPDGILETVLYAQDLERAESFYGGILGMALVARTEGQHVFFRCGQQVLLIFDPRKTMVQKPSGGLPIPPHGAVGDGHVCFRASAVEIERWHAHLELNGIDIEADFEWPQGGRSIYFRDPAGNCLEFAEPRIWGLE